jgi:hypothetical protein
MRQTYETSMRHKAARARLKRIVQVICEPLHKYWLDEIETGRVVNMLMPVRETSRTTPNHQKNDSRRRDRS